MLMHKDLVIFLHIYLAVHEELFQWSSPSIPITNPTKYTYYEAYYGENSSVYGKIYHLEYIISNIQSLFPIEYNQILSIQLQSYEINGQNEGLILLSDYNSFIIGYDCAEQYIDENKVINPSLLLLNIT